MDTLNNNWYRFPIKVTNKKLYDALDGEVPEENWERSYVDIRIDSIVAIRPYTDQNDPEDTISGTLIYTTAGEDWAVYILPKKVREILNIKPIKTNEL